MFTADQLVLHAIGDYVTQSHWMATNKTRSHVAAGLHALVYTTPFATQTWSVAALAVILVTHFLIDRYRLARYVVWAKNGARGPLTATGYPAGTPDWLAVWLLIAADNVIHVVMNGVALRWLD